MIIVLLGPPFAGKDTQSKLLTEKLGIPVFSMGAIIRDAYKSNNPKAIEGFEKYSMKGLHVPIELKFDLLRENMDKTDSFILDNFPGNSEDLESLKKYLEERKLEVDYAFFLSVDENEIFQRVTSRERKDDDPDIIKTRIKIQGEERKPVLDYFKEKGVLFNLNGQGSVEEVFERIISHIK